MKTFLLIIAIICYTTQGFAQSPGNPDPSFGDNGIVKSDIGLPYNYNAKATQVLVDSSGSLYFIIATNGETVVAKKNADGSAGTSYGKNGFSSLLSVEEAYAAIQPDGKMIVTGLTRRQGDDFGDRNFLMLRLNTDGTPDNTFGTDGIQVTNKSFAPTSIAFQADKKMIVIGYAIGYDTDPSVIAARYDADGNPDNTFGTDGVVKTQVGSESGRLIIQNDGKILITSFYDLTGNFHNVIRLTSNGTVDSTFKTTSNQFPGLSPSTIALQSDKKIIVAGNIWNEVTGNQDFAIVRYNSNGSLDSSFDGDGKQTTDFAGNHDNGTLIFIQNNGKILLIGNSGKDYNRRALAICRYNANGSLDNSYSGDGRQIITSIPLDQNRNSVFIQNNEKLIALVYDSEDENTNIVSARYYFNGLADNSYDEDGILIDHVKLNDTHFAATAIQPDGKILATGYTSNGSNYDFALVRYNRDGSIDRTFSSDGIVTLDFTSSDDKASEIAIQNDGKIVVVGSSGNNFAIARFNQNGGLDNSFSVDGKQTANFDASEESFVAIQSDGKMVAGGSNGFFNGSELVRYNANGSLDMSFGTAGKLVTSTALNKVALQKDGKIVVTGFQVVARYNIDGTADLTFGNENGMKYFYEFEDNEDVFVGKSVEIQNDGKIVTGGYMQYYSKGAPAPDFALIRLNADGTFDNNFGDNGLTIGLRGEGSSVKIQSDGKIILAGRSYPVNSDHFTILRYNKDGKPDKYFGDGGIKITPASMANDRIEGIAIANNRLYAAGYGEHYGTVGIVAKYFLMENKASVVKIIAPASNAVYASPATINISATASDADGAVSFVKFYNEGTLLKTDSTSPYTCQLTSVQGGNYSFVAKATDNNGLTSSSESVAVTVTSGTNKAPVVSITSPANNKTYVAPATITINAAASDSDGSVANVKFYNGGTLLKTDSTVPYNCTLTQVAAGNYSFIAKATDNKGLASSSASVSVSVSASSNKAPVVNITAPGNNMVYASPASITITALASDADGSITNVKFYNGGTLLKTDSISPYDYTANTVLPGNYNYIAKATDNKGQSSSSASVVVTVVETNKAPFVQITSPVKDTIYRESQSILIEAIALDEDGTVSNVKFYSGAQLLKTDSTSPYTYTANNVLPGKYNYIAKATDNKGLSSSSASVHVTVGANKAPAIKIIDYTDVDYAGGTFSVLAQASDTDGVIKYLKLYDGTTLIDVDSVGFSDTYYELTWDNVSAGNHFITVTATDNEGATTTSPVISVTVLPNKSPVVNITSPVNNAVLSSPANINISATASDADGSIQFVDFYNGTEWIGGDNNSPYSIEYYLLPGNNSFTAKATDNRGAVSTSTIHVTAVSHSTLEAEGALLNGAEVASYQPGFTGWGYADYMTSSGQFIEWQVTVADAGICSLKFRYANGGTTNRPLQLMVNGVVINANLAFSTTGGWGVWSLSSASVNLVSGTNTVRLTTIGSNGPNIDNLSFSCSSSLQKPLVSERVVYASNGHLKSLRSAESGKRHRQTNIEYVVRSSGKSSVY